MLKEAELLKEIARLREIMIVTGLNKGLSHPETVKHSQKLDELINAQLKEG
ncbi:aspartyl-phosphate phosphatase Spo0E family protein [Bacillus paranthracis]|uniref:aspartyl-phosphate phosphatase Spo0E family protein n=1 Tax=Bacillus cereus group TaxID=86661 RepID=UPI0009B58B97|nr:MULTISPECIES: aspartyl-phosphate phosphatase Spo0E family protein [Bacillus cereus group]HDR7892783.1 aspartyl-phosphate phosphatase Spo0E family protein [Bacillus toyonensis]MBM6771685.1 aspartyl-phosphate phosphatase Spo0E family protein [Bacillus cereus]MCC2380814.1 aspartyl-phosphate phosphatase Spo0E family protein [Bacillus wiedmannii]MCC2425002.1 aspartyl-phosphate phosphatase Spo0E family protein [Bacillus wiedmannii]MCC2459686.1 aspartyl-phosphate phosphatase Spo0E family protein [